MADRLNQLVQSTVEPLGLDLEDVTLTPAGKKRVLAVAVDRDGGVSIDVITQATRALSQALDASDVMGNAPYTLEVTSRGVDRPLELPRHWRRNNGRLVDVTLTDGTRHRGRIAANDDDAVTLTSSAGEQVIALDQVERALVQIELNRKDV